MKHEYRDHAGRFEPGNPGGPGRPKREVEQQYLDVTIGAVSPEDWATVVQSMLARAQAGDVAAARWLSDYVLGKPTEHIAITGDDSLKIALHLSPMESDPLNDQPGLSDGTIEQPALPAPNGKTEE